MDSHEKNLRKQIVNEIKKLAILLISCLIEHTLINLTIMVLYVVCLCDDTIS